MSPFLAYVDDDLQGSASHHYLPDARGYSGDAGDGDALHVAMLEHLVRSLNERTWVCDLDEDSWVALLDVHYCL